MAWYNSSWKYRVKITIDHSKVGSDLTDFPVYVDLSTLPSGFHTNVKSDGGDIRVTRSDGTTECPREVVSYDATNDKGELHFKANSVSSSTDTDFYIYYGNSSASDYAVDATYGAENVWTNYFAVYHLQASMLDSTTNDNDLTDGGSSDATGKIGKGRSLSGDYLKTTNSLDLSDTQKVSITCWLNKTNNTGAQLLYEFGSNYNSYTDDFVAYTDDTDFWIASKGNVGYNIAKCALPTTGSFIYLAHIRDFSASASLEVIPYINGQAVTYDKSTYNSENTGYFGNRQLFISGRNGESYFTDGIYDEFRISKNVLASTWISTEYNNQSSPSTFYTAGSQEAGATDANSERGLYIRSKNTNSSERSIYSLGSQILSTDYFNVVFSPVSVEANSGRGLYITGSDTGASERNLLLEGKPVVSERNLSLSGYIHTSSTRDLFLKGFDTDTGERGLYTQGTKSGASERSLYTQGSLEVSGERILYLIGKSLEGERELYIWGSVANSSERGLFVEGAYFGYDSRGLYIHGRLSDSSGRSIYLSGYDTETSERVLHLSGIDLGASERGLYVWGKETDTSGRSLYIHGCLEDSSERGLYLTTYALGGLERGLYTWGWEKSSLVRNIYLSGWNEGGIERKIYTQGFISVVGEKGLYLYGIGKANLERSFYIQGRLQDASERSIYTTGCIKVLEDRGLYIRGTWRPWVDKSVEYGTIYTKEITTGNGLWVDEKASGINNFTRKL